MAKKGKEEEKEEKKPEAPKEETVGAKLREEGVIREEKVVERKPEAEEKEMANFLLRVEKLEGKLEMEKEGREAINERISKFSEEIGDLRRMILDREKSSSELEANFEKVQAVVKEITPERISRDFEKFAGQLEKESAKLDMTNVKIGEFSKRLKTMEDKFAQIKSFKNLINTIEKIDKSIRDMEESKRYTDRMAGKVESIFSEITDKLAQLKRERETILKVDDLTREMVKDLDKLKLKFDEEALKKKELDGVKKEIIEESKGFSPDEFNRLKEKFELFEAQMKSVDELEKEKERIEKLLRRCEKDHGAGKLSNESYEELKEANEKKLDKINSVLEFLSKKMLYDKVKREVKKVDELVSTVEAFPKPTVMRDLIERISEVEEKERGLEEISRKAEDLNILLDRMDSLESGFEEMRESLKGTSELADRVEEIKSKRNEFEVALKEEKERMETHEGSVRRLRERLNESFNKIMALEEEIEKLKKERKIPIPIDTKEIREGLLELRDSLEAKADKKRLEELETRSEGLMEKHAQLVKELIERIKWVK